MIARLSRSPVLCPLGAGPGLVGTENSGRGQEAGCLPSPPASLADTGPIHLGPSRLPFPPGKFTAVTSQGPPAGAPFPPCGQRHCPLTCFRQVPLRSGAFFHSCSLPSHSGLPFPSCHSLSRSSSSRPPCLVSGPSLHTYFPPHLPLHRATFLPSSPVLAP